MVSSKEKAFLEAFELYASGLVRHASFRLTNRDRALDLVQETFMRTWDYVASGGTILQYKSFLYRILHNLIIDEYRKKTSRSLDELLENEAMAQVIESRLSEGGLHEAEEELDTRMLVRQVVSCIALLPEQYRLVLTMRFVDNLSITEISETTGASENAVSVRIHRGVAKLRTLCKNITHD